MTDQEIQKIVREIRRASGRAEVLRIGQYRVLLERMERIRKQVKTINLEERS